MSDIPEWAQEEIDRVRENNLTELDLSNAGRKQLEFIPDEICELRQLKNLRLTGNFTLIPEGIGNLTQLTYLQIRGKYKVIPEEIGNLTQLTYLQIRGKYKVIPEGIGNLTQLKKLLLEGDFTVIPEGIRSLNGLTWLVLRGELETIPPLVFELQRLTSLHLYGNKIRVVPREILNLSRLMHINLGSNSIETPPPEIVRSGIVGIRNYYRSLQVEEEDHLYEAKLLILGEGGAGKTSLAQKILNPNYQLKPKEKSTEGIGVMQWGFQLDDVQSFRVNMWDFGGQEIYHATHQFFLTNRSLYVLVADSRKEDTDFNYWLNIVELLGGDSPVLIVTNEKQDRKRQIGEPQLKQRFPNIVGILATNLENNRGLEQTVDEIKLRMRYLPHVGTSLPRSWVAVREELERDDRNYITIEEYYSICEKCNLRDRSKQDTVIGYLHDLGVCLHFKTDPLLKRYVILKPHWGTSAVYTVLDNKNVINSFGRFTRGQLDDIWTDESYDGMHDELLQLMMRFKLCYQLPRRADDTDDSYLAPQLLNENQSDYPWKEEDNLHLRYSYQPIHAKRVSDAPDRRHEPLHHQGLGVENRRRPLT